MGSRTDAFVIWIDVGAEPAPVRRPIRGRVEHVRTSARAAFSTPEELIEFLDRHRTADPAPPETS